jgi:hypothetical protein
VRAQPLLEERQSSRVCAEEGEADVHLESAGTAVNRWNVPPSPPPSLLYRLGSLVCSPLLSRLRSF